MKLYGYYTLLFLSITSCQQKKTTNQSEVTAPIASTTPITKVPTLADTIENKVNDIEMSRNMVRDARTFFPDAKTDVEIVRFYINNDPNQLVKLRYQYRSTTRIDIVHYYFINDTLVHLHDYMLDKNCEKGKKACVEEAKYYFQKGQLNSAVERKAEGPVDVPISIDREPFQAFTPADSALLAKQNNIQKLEKQFKSLPKPLPKN